MEEQNFFTDQCSKRNKIRPLYCYAVSAKRYALFNVEIDEQVLIRKASAHGLGHLYQPYADEDPDAPKLESGVLLWQENLWRDIVSAALRGDPQSVPFIADGRLQLPAASRYSATTPAILNWFRLHNEGRPYAEQLRPFGFLTWFHARRPEEQFFEQSVDAGDWDPRSRAPKPVAPYQRDIWKAADTAVDRETGEPVPKSWLRTYAEALRQYHIHPETKFLGGAHAQAGPLRRRHVFANAVEYIGKEADRWEEDSHFGADEDSAIAYGLSPEDRMRMIEAIAHAIRVEKIGVKRLAKGARVADRTVTAVVNGGDITLSDDDLVKLYRAVENLVAAKHAEDTWVAEVLTWARNQKASWLAAELDYNLSNLSKVLSRKIQPKRLIARMSALREHVSPERSESIPVAG